MFNKNKPHWFRNGICGVLLSGVIAVGLVSYVVGGSSPNIITATAAQKQNDIVLYRENGDGRSGLATYVVIDTATGVHYIVVGSTYGGAAVTITPRLTAEGEIY